MNQIARHATRWTVCLVAALAAACGGDDQPGAPPTTIGPSGGTVTGPSGAQVVIPAGALGANTAIAVAQTTAGAPAVPAAMATYGQMFAFTPHGTTFSTPVTVTIPFNPASVPAGRTAVLYKTTAGQAGWARVTGATISGNTITAQVTSFSLFNVASWPPEISQQPQNASVAEPAAASFTVTAIGSPPFTYQWERSIDAGVNWNNAPGASATTATYSTGATTVAADQNARYRVIVSNPDGPTTSATVTLTVTGAVVAPAITTQPQDVTVAVGGSATFTVVASGTSPTYQWQQAVGAGAFSNIAGATNASYTQSNVQAASNGNRYRAIASNSAGSATSNAATLTVGQTAAPVGVYLAAGLNFSLARTTAGAVLSWGADTVEQLGGGSGDQTRSAPAAALPTNVASIAAGALHALAVHSAGDVVGWGYNTFGQLGNGGGASVANPVTAATAAAVPISQAVAACAGTLHTLVLRSAAPYVLAMGYNGAGQLGDGTDTTRTRAVAVINTPVSAIACASSSSFAVAGGSLLSWGDNASGQLGDGSTTPRNLPGPVSGLSGVVAVAAAQNHALALLANGQVWAWGSNVNGKLGPAGPTSGNQIQSTPIQVTGLPAGDTVKAVAAGGENSAALTSSGQVFVWGINETGQLGRGSLSPGFSETPVAASLPGTCVAREVAIGPASGLNQVLVRCSNGEVYAWGRNQSGQLGLGAAAPTIVSTPTKIPGLTLLVP